MTVIGAPPFVGVAVTVYEVTGFAELGAEENEICDCPPLTAEAARTVGASGTPYGVAVTAGEDAAPVPAVFVAATVKEYAVPLVSPVTWTGLDVPVNVETPLPFAGEIVTV